MGLQVCRPGPSLANLRWPHSCICGQLRGELQTFWSEVASPVWQLLAVTVNLTGLSVINQPANSGWFPWCSEGERKWVGLLETNAWNRHSTTSHHILFAEAREEASPDSSSGKRTSPLDGQRCKSYSKGGMNTEKAGQVRVTIHLPTPN